MIVLLGLLFILISCIQTEIYEPEPKQPIEYRQKPHRDFDSIDTLNIDTTRVPITFNPTVEDWEEI